MSLPISDEKNTYLFKVKNDVAMVLKPQNSLLKDVKTTKYVNYIYNQLIQFEGYQSYKNDLEYVKHGCLLLENLVKKSDKIDKKAIILTVFQKIFNLNVAEREALSKIIEYLHNNGQIIKMSKVKGMFKGAVNYISKKIV